jgi:phosphoglycerate dehydrogenase-like enzyme
MRHARCSLMIRFELGDGPPHQRRRIACGLKGIVGLFMTSSTLTVWCNLPLPAGALAALTRGLGQHRLVRALEMPEYNQPLGRPDRLLPEADVAFGQPEADQCAASTRLLWVHVTSAGYTTFDAADVRAALIGRAIPVTTSSSVYAEPCAQHVLGYLLADARQLPRSLRDQASERGWNTTPTRAASLLLAGQTVLLVGLGAIGARLAELLAPFGIRLVGFRRQPRGDEPVETRPVADLPAWLPRADFVIDLLPASGETADFFDGAKFAIMKPGAVFINVGRGTTVDQEALLAALRGHLRAAYLDVTVPEPLPPKHPLWSEPKCIITPHVAGGHVDEYDRLVAVFLANFQRFLHGQPLTGRVY